MLKRVFGSVLVVCCLFVAAQAAHAQGGGKAEANRIKFKRGAHSTTLRGKLKGDEQAEYVFGGSKGQAISINVSSVPANAIALELQTSDGEGFELQSMGSKWTGNIPESGDYMLYVKLVTPGPKRASYTLTLAIN
jgi:hypothetical protein